MTVATAGAFAIHQPIEAVAVMVFCKTGEILQGLSVQRSRRSIRGLLELRPDSARRRGSESLVVRPEEVAVGEEIVVRAGERVPLDGIVLSGNGFVDTSALTGEPVPRQVEPGGEVLAGFISMDGSIEIRVSRVAGESSAAKIIEPRGRGIARKGENRAIHHRDSPASIPPRSSGRRRSSHSFRRSSSPARSCTTGCIALSPCW